jgi:hypothetical protein
MRPSSFSSATIYISVRRGMSPVVSGLMADLQDCELTTDFILSH